MNLNSWFQFWTIMETYLSFQFEIAGDEEILSAHGIKLHEGDARVVGLSILNLEQRSGGQQVLTKIR